MTFRQYTQCVQPADYNDPTPSGSPNDWFWSLVTGGGFEQARAAVCDYLLHGKLVCLNGDQCAIGRVTKLEPPGDSSFPQSIDNDFSLNILLMPHDLGEFAHKPYLDNYWRVANDGHQGFLLIEQQDMPTPKSPLDNFDASHQPSAKYQGQYTEYPSSSYISYDPSASPFQVPGSDEPFDVPVLHLECEGSRINDICEALTQTWGPFSWVCHIPIFGGFLCTLLSLILLPFLGPIVMTAIAAAWSSAIDGDAADVMVGGGTLTYGDLIVVTGRWVYDAAHEGWNELHPVKKIQKLGGTQDPIDDGGDFDGWRQRWCSSLADVPPFEGPGLMPLGMTPAQTETWNNQVAPENQWVFHPEVDGCAPAAAPPPIQ